jgi:hypothetical protein
LRWKGAVAQLGERVVRNDEVRGSIPLGSTKKEKLGTTILTALRQLMLPWFGWPLQFGGHTGYMSRRKF